MTTEQAKQAMGAGEIDVKDEALAHQLARCSFYREPFCSFEQAGRSMPVRLE